MDAPSTPTPHAGGTALDPAQTPSKQAKTLTITSPELVRATSEGRMRAGAGVGGGSSMEQATMGHPRTPLSSEAFATSASGDAVTATTPTPASLSVLGRKRNSLEKPQSPTNSSSLSSTNNGSTRLNPHGSPTSSSSSSGSSSNGKANTSSTNSPVNGEATLSFAIPGLIDPSVSMTSGFHFEPVKGRELRYNHIPLRFFRKRRPADFSVPSIARAFVAARVAARYLERYVGTRANGSQELDALAKILTRTHKPDLLGRSRAALEKEVPKFIVEELNRLKNEIDFQFVLNPALSTTLPGAITESVSLPQTGTDGSANPPPNATWRPGEYIKSDGSPRKITPQSQKAFEVLAHEVNSLEREHVMKSIFLTRGWLSTSPLQRLVIQERQRELDANARKGTRRKLLSQEAEQSLLRKRLDRRIRVAIGDIIKYEALRHWDRLPEETQTEYLKRFPEKFTPAEDSARGKIGHTESKHEEVSEESTLLHSNAVRSLSKKPSSGNLMTHGSADKQADVSLDDTSWSTNEWNEHEDEDDDGQITESDEDTEDGFDDSGLEEDYDNPEIADELSETSSDELSLFHRQGKDRQKSSHNETVIQSRNRVKFFGASKSLPTAIQAAYLAELVRRFDDPLGEETDVISESEWDDWIEWTLARWKWERYLCTAIRYSADWRLSASDALFMGPSLTLPDLPGPSTQTPDVEGPGADIPFHYDHYSRSFNAPLSPTLSPSDVGLSPMRSDSVLNGHGAFSLASQHAELNLELNMGQIPVWAPLRSPDYLAELGSETIRAAWKNEGSRLFLIIAEGADGGYRVIFSRASERRRQLIGEHRLALNQLTSVIELVQSCRKALKLRKQAQTKLHIPPALADDSKAGTPADPNTTENIQAPKPDYERLGRDLIVNALTSLATSNQLVNIPQIYSIQQSQAHSNNSASARNQDEQSDVSAIPRNYFTPLACADYDMRCPLHLIASEGHDGLARLILRRFSNLFDINAKDRFGSTALDDALRHPKSPKHCAVVSSLIAAGALVGDVSRYAARLVDAVKLRDYKTIELLLACGADPDLADAAGNIPLHLAVSAGDLEACRLLLQAHANPYLIPPDSDPSSTPAALAAKSPDSAIRALFAKYGYLPTPTAALTPFSCALFFVQTLLIILFAMFVVYSPTLRTELTDPLFALHTGRSLLPNQAQHLAATTGSASYSVIGPWHSSFRNNVFNVRALDRHTTGPTDPLVDRHGPMISHHLVDRVRAEVDEASVPAHNHMVSQTQDAISAFSSSVPKMSGGFLALPTSESDWRPVSLNPTQKDVHGGMLRPLEHPSNDILGSSQVSMTLLSGLPAHVATFVASTIGTAQHPLATVLSLLSPDSREDGHAISGSGNTIKQESAMPAQDQPRLSASAPRSNLFPIFTDAHVLAFMGFGYLVSLYRNRQTRNSSLGPLLLVVAIAVQIYIIAQGFWSHWFSFSLPLYSKTTSVTRHVYYQDAQALSATVGQHVEIDSWISHILSQDPNDVPLIVDSADFLTRSNSTARDFFTTHRELGSSLTRVLVDVLVEPERSESPGNGHQKCKITRRIVTSTVTLTGFRPTDFVRHIYRLFTQKPPLVKSYTSDRLRRTHDNAFMWEGGRKEQKLDEAVEWGEFESITEDSTELWTDDFIEGFEQAHSRLHDAIHSELLALVRIERIPLEIVRTSTDPAVDPHYSASLHTSSSNNFTSWLTNNLNGLRLPYTPLHTFRVTRPTERTGISRGWLPSTLIASVGWPSSARLHGVLLQRQAENVQFVAGTAQEINPVKQNPPDPNVFSRVAPHLPTSSHQSRMQTETPREAGLTSKTLIATLEQQLQKKDTGFRFTRWVDSMLTQASDYLAGVRDQARFIASEYLPVKVTAFVSSVKRRISSFGFRDRSFIEDNKPVDCLQSWLSSFPDVKALGALPEVSYLMHEIPSEPKSLSGSMPSFLRRRLCVKMGAKPRKSGADPELTVTVRVSTRRLKDELLRRPNFVTFGQPNAFHGEWYESYVGLGAQLASHLLEETGHQEKRMVGDQPTFQTTSSFHESNPADTARDEKIETTESIVYQLLDIPKLLSSLVIPISSANLLQADLCVGSIFIATVALAGYATGPRILLITIVQVVIYALNEELSIFLRTSDGAGAVILHLFGALFGVFAAIGLFATDWVTIRLYKRIVGRRSARKIGSHDLNNAKVQNILKTFFPHAWGAVVNVFIQRMSPSKSPASSEPEPLHLSNPIADSLDETEDATAGAPYSRKKSVQRKARTLILEAREIPRPAAVSSVASNSITVWTKLKRKIADMFTARKPVQPLDHINATALDRFQGAEKQPAESCASTKWDRELRAEFELFGYDNPEEWDEWLTIRQGSEFATGIGIDTDDDDDDDLFDDEFEFSQLTNDDESDSNWSRFETMSIGSQSSESLHLTPRQYILRKRHERRQERRRLRLSRRTMATVKTDAQPLTTSMHDLVAPASYLHPEAGAFCGLPEGSTLPSIASRGSRLPVFVPGEGSTGNGGGSSSGLSASLVTTAESARAASPLDSTTAWIGTTALGDPVIVSPPGSLGLDALGIPSPASGASNSQFYPELLPFASLPLHDPATPKSKVHSSPIIMSAMLSPPSLGQSTELASPIAAPKVSQHFRKFAPEVLTTIPFSLDSNIQSPASGAISTPASAVTETLATRLRKQLVLAPALGTIFLLLFWPALNSMLLPGISQHRAVVNTILSMAGACVAAFGTTHVLRDAHFDLSTAQHAIIGGGIACAACVDSILYPAYAILVGALSGGLIIVALVVVRAFATHRHKQALRRRMRRDKGEETQRTGTSPARVAKGLKSNSDTSHESTRASEPESDDDDDDVDVDSSSEMSQGAKKSNPLEKLSLSSSRFVDTLTLFVVHALPALVGALFNAYLAYTASIETYGLDALSAVFPAMAQGCTGHTGVGAAAALAVASTLLGNPNEHSTAPRNSMPHMFPSELHDLDDPHQPATVGKIRQYDPSQDPFGTDEDHAAARANPGPAAYQLLDNMSQNPYAKVRKHVAAQAYLFYNPSEMGQVDEDEVGARQNGIRAENFDPDSQVWFQPVPVTEAYNLVMSHYNSSLASHSAKGEHQTLDQTPARDPLPPSPPNPGVAQKLHIPKGLRVIVCSGSHRTGKDQAHAQLLYIGFVCLVSILGGLFAGCLAGTLTSGPRLWMTAMYALLHLVRLVAFGFEHIYRRAGEIARLTKAWKNNEPLGSRRTILSSLVDLSSADTVEQKPSENAHAHRKVCPHLIPLDSNCTYCARHGTLKRVADHSTTHERRAPKIRKHRNGHRESSPTERELELLRRVNELEEALRQSQARIGKSKPD